MHTNTLYWVYVNPDTGRLLAWVFFVETILIWVLLLLWCFFPSQVSVREQALPSLVSWRGALGRRSAPASSLPSWPVDKLACLLVSPLPFHPTRDWGVVSPSYSKTFETLRRMFRCCVWCSVPNVKGRHWIESLSWRLLTSASCFHSSSSS